MGRSDGLSGSRRCLSRAAAAASHRTKNVRSRRSLGMDLPIEECARLLRTLEFQVSVVGTDVLRATMPSHRLDIQEGPADLIEDLVRLYGYDKLPATLLADQLPAQATSPPIPFEERVRDLLVDVGLQEVITYSLTTPEREALLGVPLREYVRLLNPVSSERSVMRQSVLASVLEVAERNLRYTNEVRLFEIGSVYLDKPDQKLPDEPRRLAIVLLGNRFNDFWGDAGKLPNTALDFFDLKGIVVSLAEALHLPEVTFRPAVVPYLHPGKSADLVVGEQVVGQFGAMHPRVAEAMGFRDRTILAGEFDLELLAVRTPVRHRAAPVPQFPAALRDVAVVVEETMPAERSPRRSRWRWRVIVRRPPVRPLSRRQHPRR